MHLHRRSCSRGRWSGIIGFIGTYLASAGCDPGDGGAGKPAAELPGQAVSRPSPKEVLPRPLPSANQPREAEATIIERKLRAELLEASKKSPGKTPPRPGDGKEAGTPKSDVMSRRDLQRQRAAERAKTD